MSNWFTGFTDLFKANQRSHIENPIYFDSTLDSSFQAQLVGKKYVQLACNVDIVDTILIYLSNWYSKGIPYELTPSGEKIYESDLIDLINQPNSLQSKEEFMAEHFYYLHAAGTNYIYPIKKSIGLEGTPEGTSLVNLNYDNVEEPQTSQSVFEIDNDINLKYIEEVGGKRLTTSFNFDEIIPFFDSTAGSSGKLYKGKSRLESLHDEIKNIYLATKGKQNKLDLSGITLITPQDRSSSNSVSKGLDRVITTGENGGQTTHKDHIERKFNASGLSKGRSIIVGSTELKAMNLTESLEKLDFDSQRIEELRTIKRKYFVPENLLPLTSSGATFENQEKEVLNLLQTAIEPVAMNKGASISKWFGSENTLMFDYSHLPAYSIIEKQKTESEQRVVNMYVAMVKENIITSQQAATMLKDKGILV